MSTYYDQFMQNAGTNYITTNADFQTAIKQVSDAYDQQAAADLQAQFSSFLWHSIILIAACLCAYFLWRIVQLKKKESLNTHLIFDEKKACPPLLNHEPVDKTPITTKPPLLDLQHRTPQSRLPEKAANDASDFSSHPHSRFMRKN